MSPEKRLAELLNTSSPLDETQTGQEFREILFYLCDSFEREKSTRLLIQRIDVMSDLLTKNLFELREKNTDLQIRLEGVHKGLLELQKKLLK